MYTTCVSGLATGIQIFDDAFRGATSPLNEAVKILRIDDLIVLGT